MAIGQRVPMIDAHERVTGRVRYVLNVELPGMLVGKVLRSPHPHARIVRLDTSAAERLPGVLAVLSRADLQNDRFDAFYGALLRDQPVVALDRVRYAGEAVAAVAAIDEDTAARALELIEVEYEELPAVFDPLEALAPDAPRVHESNEAGNLADRFEITRGDVEQGFRQADFVLEEEYRCPPVQHVTLEPHVSVAQVEGGRVTVWSSTQTPYVIRDQLAQVFKLPHTRVRVIVHTLGGGYGAKTYPKLEPITALLAWKARRPVRFALTRSEDFLSTCRSGAIIRLKTGLMRDGMLVARQATCYYNKGAYTETGPRVTRNGAQASVAAYRIPHVALESYAVFTNLVPSGPFRGPGVAQSVWASECHMDEIARRLGIDPLELRRKNLVRDGDRYIGGGELNDLHLEELLDDAAHAIGRDDPPAVPPQAGGQAGMAPSPPAGRAGVGSPSLRRGRAVALCVKTSRTPSTSTTACKLNEDGSLSVLVSSVEMGQGLKTALSQIAAEATGVPLDQVSISEPDTDLTPYDDTTSASRTTYVMGGALQVAGQDLRQQLADLASAELEVSTDDLVMSDGVVSVRGAPDRMVSYGELVRKARLGNVIGHGTFTSQGRPDPVTGQPGASSHWHQAAAAAEVDVDTETGQVHLLRCHAGAYAGRMVNPLHCELQVEGSTIFGLGQSLMEQMSFEDGRLTNPNLSDYLIPSFGDLPPSLSVSVLEEPGSEEIHGIGETALPPTIAAISAAVADAIGTSILELPLTPERVLRALHDRESAERPTGDAPSARL